MDYEALEDGLQGFDPVAVYDAPNVALTQYLDDELTWRSFKQTFFSPSDLSPKERDSYTDRLKKRFSNSALGDTLIDIATNPFVWLMFITSPAAGKSIETTGRIFTGKKYSEFVIGNKSVLKSLGALNAHQMGQGTALPTVLNSMTRRIDDLVEQEQIVIRPVLQNLQKRISDKFGLKTPINTLVPERAPEVYANINGKYISLPDYLREAQTYMHAVMDGFNKQVVRRQSNIGFANNVVTQTGKKIPVTRDQAGQIQGLLRDLDEGVITPPQFEAGVRPILGKEIPVRVSRSSRLSGESETAIRQNLDPDNLMGQWLEREGFVPLMAMSRNVMKQRYSDLFLNAKGGYDDKKILRVYNNLKKSVQIARAEDTPFLASEYFGHVNNEMAAEIVKGLRSGKLKLGEFKQLLKDQRSLDDLETYMPRNIWSNISSDGQKVRVDRFIDERKKANFASGRVRERSVQDGIYDPEDLGRIANLYAESGRTNKALENFIGRNRELIDKAFKAGPEDGIVQVSNLNFQPSIQKYLKQTRNDVALYADEVSADIKIGFKDFPVQKAKDATQAVKERNILGGETRYDALQKLVREFELAGDQATSSYVQSVLLPRIKGDMKITDLVGYHAMLGTQKIAQGLVESPFMKKVAGQNPESSRFVGALKSFAKRDLTAFDGSEFGRGATTMLYSSHLGFNPSSAVLNLFQPLLFAQTWVGSKNMAKGYGEALKQYFGYINARLKMPLRANADEVDELRRRYFRLSNVGGDDLLNIRASSYELLDQVAFATVADKNSGKFKFLTTELPLKMFQHTEIFNRVATGEATFAAMQSAGRIKGIKTTVNRGLTDYNFVGKQADVIRGTDNIRSLVQNTQFGSDIVNSPAMFQKGILSLPWIRQFLTFPMRTFTSWTDTAPMINQGRRTWGVTGYETQGKFSAMMHDLFRTLGTSAVVYETGKNMFGMDFSKGLGATTIYESSIVGPILFGERQSLGYRLPFPPVFDMAIDGAAAMTDEDKSVFGAMIPRVLPGGIAMQRALNLAPQITNQYGFLGGLQKEYTDWSQTNQNGEVPIFREDGSIIKYESGLKRILASAGLGPYMNKQNQELHKFLVKNREQFNAMKSDYIVAMTGNNMQRANMIARQFEKKFGIPLTVTEQQIERHLQTQRVPLRERMLDRMSPDIRPQYQPIIQAEGGTIGGPIDRSTAEKARMSPNVFENYTPF